MSEEVVEATEVLTPERVTGIPDMDDSPSVAVIMESLDTNEDMMDAVAAAIVDSPAGNADAGGEAADESPQRRSRRKRVASKSAVKEKSRPLVTNGKGTTKKAAPKKAAEKKKAAPKKAAKTAAKPKTGGGGTQYVEVYCGPPTETIDGGWPEGWVKKTFERRGTVNTDGRKDNYWYTPKEQLKLRSILEVKRFMSSLEEAGGDEKKARVLSKQKK